MTLSDFNDTAVCFCKFHKPVQLITEEMKYMFILWEPGGLFQLGVKPILKQDSGTFKPPNKEVKINNIKPFPVHWT